MLPAARSTQPTGSLRETLVEAAAALIAKKGPQGFSLREVARRAHVSEAAPYWHFTDREALLAAVAERGFVEMAKGMMTIWGAVSTRASACTPSVSATCGSPSRTPRICA